MIFAKNIDKYSGTGLLSGSGYQAARRRRGGGTCRGAVLSRGGRAEQLGKHLRRIQRQTSRIGATRLFRYAAEHGVDMFGIDLRRGEDDDSCQEELRGTEDFGGEELPVQGIILESDDEDVGMQFFETVGELDRIPVSHNRVFL